MLFRSDYWVTVPATMLVAGSGALQNPDEVLTASERAGLARTAATRHGLGHAFPRGATRQDEPTIHAAE